jgi:hypothetical protein
MRELREVVSTPLFYNISYWRTIPRHLGVVRRVTGLITGRLQRRHRGLAKIHFFQFVEWDENRIVSTLENELGWQRAADQSTTTRFDCKLHVVISRWCSKYLGITDKELMYSMMIRENMITRDAALERLKAEEADELRLLEPYMSDIADALGALKQRDRIMDVWRRRLGKDTGELAGTSGGRAAG